MTSSMYKEQFEMQLTRELENIGNDPRVYLAITIHLKLNWYAPKYSIEYLKNINTGEKQKASHSKNDLLNDWRRRRDLNPRAAFTTYTLSRGASSANLSTSPNIYIKLKKWRRGRDSNSGCFRITSFQD